MSNEKRFTAHIEWFNRDKTEGEITLEDRGQPLLASECIEDVRLVKRLLNKIYDENNELKQLLEEIRHEITCIDGLNAFDIGAWYLGYVEVFNKNIIELNYAELLKKIDKVIK